MHSLPRTILTVGLLHNAIACDPRATPEPSSPQTSASAQAAPLQAAGSATSSGALTASLPQVDPPSPEAGKKLATSSNAFGFDLYSRLRKSPGNLVLSPASITTALTMTWGGAKGETAQQMKDVLHLDGSSEEVMMTAGTLSQSLQSPSRPVTFRIANQLFGEKTYGFEAVYLDKTKRAFGAPLELLDFKAASGPSRTHINRWVESKTERRIKDLIPADGIDDQTRLVLVNAIYFLGDWAEPFEKAQTWEAPFSLSAKEQKDVPTMHRVDSFRIAQKDGVTALELPYKGDQMSMLLLVPDASDGIARLESSINAAKLSGLTSALKDERVRLSLPKFEVQPANAVRLGDHLKAMGMTVAFDQSKADFTGIANPANPTDRLHIGEVFHKSFVRVDEKGTEAAAATAVAMPKGAGMPEKTRELKVDRPFLFVIRDKASEMVLFMGRVSDPTQN